MQRAREAINRAGGIAAVNSYTKFYLAMLGQIPGTSSRPSPPDHRSAELVLLQHLRDLLMVPHVRRPLSIIWAEK